MKLFYRFMSYVGAYTLGAYTIGALHGFPPAWYQWVTTSVFGLFFYYQSLPDKLSRNANQRV